MNTQRLRPFWPVPALFALGLAALYAGSLGTGFLNDDYLFLEEARTRSLAQSLVRLGALGNYYRPLSRQIYFALLSPIAGGHPLVFHLVNFTIFLGALALLADLLLHFTPRRAALAGVLYFALLPFQRLALTWVSCSQDLLALLFALAALALYRRGRMLAASFAFLCAAASKESALALPLVTLAWDTWIEPRGTRERLRRLAPLAAVTVGWTALAAAVRAGNPAAAAFLRFTPAQFAAALVHEIQSLIGLDHPAGFLDGLARRGPAVLPLALLGAIAIWNAPEKDAGPPARRAVAFALVWLAAFGALTGPVAHTWSSYFYMLAAVGATVLVALASRRMERWLWLGLTAGLLWWHAGATATRAFAIVDDPWGWTSHLTSYYFERAAALTDTMSRQLRTLDPAPPPRTRFFFATLPPWAGFQMGSGALVRALYRDPSLGSYFYSQFSESTADDRPCRFFYWDGARLTPLYPRLANPFFQVGADLILLERPAGAAHAFHRGLALSPPLADRMDLLYWLGWTELWLGARDSAEAAWQAFGAADDSLYWSAHLRAAHNALVDGDTLDSRRHLAEAIHYGIGRPEAHAVLGELLMAKQPKYAMLELEAAVWLKPRDWLARRDLVLALTAARLDDAAGRHLATLKDIYAEWRADRQVAEVDSTLRARGGGAAAQGIARF